MITFYAFSYASLQNAMISAMMVIAMSSLHRPQSGFTLIEIMIVVAVLGMLVVLSLPQFLGFNRRSILNSNTTMTMDTIKSAQSLAEGGVQSILGTKIGEYSFRFNTVSGSCRDGVKIVRVDDTGTDAGVELGEETLSCGVIIESSWSSLDFEVPNGTISNLVSNPQTYRVCYPGEGYFDVSIDASGRTQKSAFNDNGSACTCTPSC